MPSPKARRVAGDRALLRNWRQEGPTGTAAKAWLVARRLTALLVALSLVGVLGYIIVSPWFRPKTYFVYWGLDEVEPLSAPPVDYTLEDFAAFSKLQGGLSPLQPHKALLFSRMASPEQVLAHVASFSNANIADNGCFIAYISAHGLVRNGHPYLMCSNFTDAAGDTGDNKGLIPIDKLLESLHELPGETKLLLLDATRLEYAPRLGVTANFFTESLKAKVEELALPDVYVLCSSSPGESSQVSRSLNRSVFAHICATGLQGAADLNNDRDIELREFYDFVQFNVTRWVGKVAGGLKTQTPLLLGANVSQSSGGQRHLLFTRNLPPLENDDESSGSIVDSVVEFAIEEPSEFGLDPVIEWAQQVVSGVRGAIGGSEREDEKQDEGKVKEETNSESISDNGEQTLLNDAWARTRQIEDSAVSPLEYAPHLWRAHKDRLIWLERRQQAGERLDKRPLVDELRSVVDSLTHFHEQPSDKKYPIDFVRSCRPVTRLATSDCPTLALAEMAVRSQPGGSLPEGLGTFVASYDGWLAASQVQQLDKLKKLVEDSVDESWQSYYEFQLVKPLLDDDTLQPETVRLALEVRRLGEQVSTDLICGQGWYADAIDSADRLRLDAERMLLDKASRDWQSLAIRKLRDARNGYVDVRQRLATVQDSLRTYQELLHTAPEHLRWCRLSSGDNGSRAPTLQNLDSLWVSLSKFEAEIDGADRNRSPGTYLDRSHRDLAAQVDKAVAELTDETIKEGDSLRLDALLATTLLDEKERSRCLSARANAEDVLIRGFVAEAPEKLSSRTVSADQLRRIAEYVLIGQKLWGRSSGTLSREPAPLETSSANIANLQRLSDELGKLISGLPEDLFEVASESADLSNRSSRATRTANLLRVQRGLFLVDAMDTDAVVRKEDNRGARDPLLPLRNARWFDLLSCLGRRHAMALYDARAQESSSILRISEQFASLAREIPNQPKPDDVPLTVLEMNVSQPSVELTTSATAQLAVRLKSPVPMDVVLMAKYNPDAFDVNVAGPGSIVKEHEILESRAGNSTGALRYPYRPSGEVIKLAANQEHQLTVRLNRTGREGGNANLVLRAVGQPDYVRKEVKIVLPGEHQLQFSVAGHGPIDGNSRSVVNLFPNRKQPLTIQVANTGSTSKKYLAHLYAPEEESDLSIPQGSVASAEARRILRGFSPRQVALGAELLLPADDIAVPIEFDFEAPDNKRLLGAKPTEGDGGVSLPMGLLLVLEDQERPESIIRWLKFEILRPHGYLSARANYNPSRGELAVTVAATKPEILPSGTMNIELDVDEAFLSGTQKNSMPLGAGSNYQAQLVASLNGKWPRDLDGLAPDYLTARVNVDGYPRGFVFHVRKSSEPRTLLPEREQGDQIGVKVVPLQEGTVFKADTPLRARFEIDAPDTYFNRGDYFVELGLDRDGRDLDQRDIIVERVEWDRRAALTALKPDSKATIAIKPTVGDFEIELPTKGISGRFNIMAEFNPETEYADYLEITLDGETPQISSAQIIPEGDKLIVIVDVTDSLSGVKAVQGAFDPNAEKWEEGEDLGSTRWRIPLKTAELAPGSQQVYVRAIDLVGNVSQEPVGDWTKIRARTPNDASDAAADKPQPVTNRVSGTVTYSTRRDVTEVSVELVGAGGTLKAVINGPRFVFDAVPPGDYTIKARGLAGGTYRIGEQSVTVSAQPKTPVALELKIR